MYYQYCHLLQQTNSPACIKTSYYLLYYICLILMYIHVCSIFGCDDVNIYMKGVK